MGRELDLSEVKAGNKYFYQETVYSEGLDIIAFTAVVDVVGDFSNDEYWNFVLKIDKWIDGLCKELPKSYKFVSSISKQLDEELKNHIKKMGWHYFYAIK